MVFYICNIFSLLTLVVLHMSVLLIEYLHVCDVLNDQLSLIQSEIQNLSYIICHKTKNKSKADR